MATTTSDAFQAAITFTVQNTVLTNLRNDLVWANPALAEQGRFDKASDMLTFLKFPDLSSTTPQTPLTEGSAPTARAITMTTVTVSTAQYGDLVDISDIAKVKAPEDVIAIASERVGRTAKEVMDTITRDVIFLSGTAFIQGALSTTNAARSDLGSTEYLVGTDLVRLRSTMKAGNVPIPSDGYYRLYVGNNVAHDLRTDTTASSSWIEPAKYTERARAEIQSGEIGILNGFRVIESDTAPTFSSTTTVYGSLAVGALKGWGAGELQTFQTYHVAPGGDHSDPLAQIEEVGWKMNFGVAALNNGYYYRVESAARAL
jgi:N4-gp56 family major capsid protein